MDQEQLLHLFHSLPSSPPPPFVNKSISCDYLFYLTTLAAREAENIFMSPSWEETCVGLITHHPEILDFELDAHE